MQGIHTAKLAGALCCAVFVLSSCITEQTAFPMGNGRHTLFIRGSSFADSGQLSSAFYTKASTVCPTGFDVEKMETKDAVRMGYYKPVLEGVVVCK